MLVPYFLALLARPATLTFRCSATKMEQLAATLAEKTGENLKVARPFEGRFVVVRFKDTPVDEALARIADAVDGKWVMSGPIKLLQANPAGPSGTKDKMLREALDRFLAPDPTADNWTQKDADKLVGEAMAMTEQNADAPGQWEKVQALDERGPRSKVVKRLARLIGAQELLRIPNNGRVVYASQPTRMQRPLPQGSDEAVAKYVRESKLHQEALARKGIDNQHPADMHYYMELLQAREREPEHYSKALLSVKRTMGGISFELVLQDGDNTTNLFANVNSFNRQVGKEPGTQIRIDGTYTPSADSKLLANAFLQMNGAPTGATPLTPGELVRVKEIFNDLEKNELLALAPSEILLQAADALDRDMAASLTDVSIVSLGLMGPTEKPPLSQFFAENMSPWRATLDEKGLTVRAMDEFYGFDFTLPRRQVGIFTKDVTKHGLTIDALADLVAATPSSEISQFAVMFACVPFPGLGRSLMFNEGEPALRAYAKLDPGSRQKAKQDVYNANFGTLPQPIKDAVSNFVYNDAQTVDSGPINMDEQHVYRQGLNADKDVTALFPSGIPNNAVVSFRVRTKESLFLATQYGPGSLTMTEPMDEDGIANRLAWSEKMRGTEGYEQSSKVAIGNLTQLDMVVSLRPNASAHCRFQLVPHFDDKELKDVSGLPDARRKTLEEKLAKEREQLKDVKFSPNRPGRIKP